MNRLLIVPILAACVWPASMATAHVLSLTVAAAKARSEALVIAGSFPRDRPRVSVRSCSRVSRHMVDCRVRYRFVGSRLTCFQRIRVKFTSDTRRRLAVSFPPPPAWCL